MESKKERQKIRVTKRELKNILSEYEPDILTDTDEFHKYKEALQSLPKSEMIIFALYAELQSERKVAELLGVSRSPIHKLIVEIRKKILNYYDNDKPTDNPTADSVHN